MKDRLSQGEITKDALQSTVEAGAENVTLCDTNGASLPNEVASATATVVYP